MMTEDNNDTYGLGKNLQQEGPCEKCGTPATLKYDNGLPVGIYCDGDFGEMVQEARQRSW